MVGTRARARSSPTSSTPSRARRGPGQKGVSHVPVDEEGLGRVADPGTLHLGVHHDGQRHLEIGGVRRRRRGSCRRRRSRRERWPRSRMVAMRDAPPRGMRQSMTPSSRMNSHRRLAAGILDEHDDVFGQARFPGRLAQAGHDGHVGPQGRGRTPQDGGVPGLQAQTGGIAGDVGPVLVDDPDDAERHPDPLDPQAVRADRPLDHLTDRDRAGRPPGAGRRPWRRSGPR